MNAIFSLGLVSAGSNNSRLAGQLRQLAAYHSEETNPLLIVRIAQGLMHMGKGLMTINPLYSNNFLVNNVALAGLLIAVMSFTEVETLICGRHQYLIYSLCLAMTPRMVMMVKIFLKLKFIFLIG
jgi:26S proteasome regulatory subunit N1